MKVALSSQKLDFGEIFIHYPYEKIITLHNDTDQPARYEMVPQEDQSSATYTLEEDGVVEAYSLKNVKVTFTSNKLGPINVPMFIRIKGSPHPPLQATLSAISIGPNVTLDYKKEKINFGRIQVLTKHERKVKLINDSLIPANFSVDLKKKKTYNVDIENGIIEPKQSVTLTVSVNPWKMK